MRLVLLLLLTISLSGAEPERIILDATSVKNLGIETVEAEESAFEQTLFAIGRLEVLPGKRAIVSSRIPGRAFSVLALPHQSVEEGDELMWVESRQPGDPPPTVMLPAPMSGLVAKVDIAVGQPIHPDQALMEIIDLTVIEATAQIPQHLAGRLAIGQRARIRVASQPDRVLEADLVHLGAYANESAGTVEASFHLPNEDLKLRPGLRAEFSIITGRRENVTTVPREALQGDAIARYVFVKDFELANAFVRVPVQTGEQNDQRVEILHGLLPGDEVVTHGAYALAFAGKGNVSLKAALDAAHGHAHHEDGTEMKEGEGHEHHEDHEHPQSPWNHLTLFFAASTGLLLLILGLAIRKPTAA
jgi:multidrug efflux pump subunit AcrA (membrane-fusion protein)